VCQNAFSHFVNKVLLLLLVQLTELGATGPK